MNFRPASRLGRVLSAFSSRKNHYDVLQSSPSASQEQLKSKYYSLVKKYHPDVSSANHDYIKVLNEAYSVLSDETARKKYDLEQGFISRKPVDHQAVSPKDGYEAREQAYKPHRPYYDEQKQMFRSKLRRRPGSAYHLLFQNFIIGMLMAAVLLLIFGLPAEERRHQKAAPRKMGREEFERQFQASLMRGKAEQ